jgi:hypothetical protein
LVVRGLGFTIQYHRLDDGLNRLRCRNIIDLGVELLAVNIGELIIILEVVSDLIVSFGDDK